MSRETIWAIYATVLVLAIIIFASEVLRYFGYAQ